MRRRSGGKRFWLSVFSATLLFAVFLSPCLFMTMSSFAEESYGYGCDGIDWPASFSESTSEEGWSSVVSRVKNPSSSSGNAFLTDVWAKPGDSVTWRHCYFPGAQKVIGTYNVTTNHPDHSKTISSASSNVFNITNESLRTLTANEMASHLDLIDTEVGLPSLNDGPYSYIPNYSRVTNFANYYGGHNIFNNVPQLAAGESGAWYADNNYSGNEISEAGKTYTEKQELKQDNHARIVIENHEWPCSYTVTYDPPSDHRDKCLIGYDKKQVHDCMQYQYDSAGHQTDTCLYYGPWYEVDDPQKPKYKEPCTESFSLTCKHNQTYYELVKNTDTKGNTAPNYSEAHVHVPYNFNMSAKMNISDKYAYVGETVKITNIEVKVNNRRNNTTNGDYSTKVASKVYVQFATFISDSDRSNNNMTNSLPGNAAIDTASYKVADSMEPGQVVNPKLEVAVNVNVNDVDLTNNGKWFCVAIRVSPGDSGSDTTMDAGGYGGYRTSAIVCRQMAKKPTLQVWGGNLFSNGIVRTSAAKKNNGNGLNYVVTGHNTTNQEKIYGSWGELGVMVLKTNTGFASANTLSSSGRAVNVNNSNQAFCKVESILSFANYMSTNICSDGKWQETGKFGIGGRGINKEAIIGEFINDDTKVNCSGYVDINGDHFNTGNTNPESVGVSRVTVNDNVVRSLYCNNAINFGRSNVGFGSTSGRDSLMRDRATTWIVRSSGNITITDDIIYDASKNYTSFNDMQKLIIYSKKNINIKCNVSRIDAVLISEKINTCSNATSDSNDWTRNVKLQINGAVITNELIPGRNYGSNGGVYPAEPAEIINHDSSLLLWGRSQADVSESNKTYTTYTRELAPRY